MVRCLYRPHLNAATAVSMYNEQTGLITGVPQEYFQDIVSEPFYTEYYDGQEDVTQERIWGDMFQINTRLIVFSYMNIGTYQYISNHRFMRIWETMEDRDELVLPRAPFHTENSEWVPIGAAKAIVRQTTFKTPLAMLMYDKATNYVMTHLGLRQLDIPHYDEFKAKPLMHFADLCCDKDAVGLVLIDGKETMCYSDDEKVFVL